MEYQLTEKIYFLDNSYDEQTNKNMLINFFQEYISRKKGDSFQEGLHAGIVIAKDRWAAKINENDGQACHEHTNMNLIRFLNGSNYFLTEQEAAKKLLSKAEINQITKDLIHISLLSKEDKCRVLMFSYNNTHSNFQITIMKEILNICKEIKKNYQNNLEIGFFNRDGTIEVEELTKNHEMEIINYISQYENKEENRTIK